MLSVHQGNCSKINLLTLKEKHKKNLPITPGVDSFKKGQYPSPKLNQYEQEQARS